MKCQLSNDEVSFFIALVFRYPMSFLEHVQQQYPRCEEEE